MDITIKDEEFRFGCRTAAIIFDLNNKKVLFQRIKNIYMLPGGRLKVGEDSKDAILRELEEELNIKEDVSLKYSVENFTILPNGQKYHEIGYYYIVAIDSNKYNLNKDDDILTLDRRDGEVYFKWLDLNNLDDYQIMPKNIVTEFKKLANNKDYNVEHLIYREF